MATEYHKEFICPKCLKKEVTYIIRTSSDADGDSDWTNTYYCENCKFMIESYEDERSFFTDKQQIILEEKANLIYKIEKTEDQKEIVRIDFLSVDENLIKYFTKHPNELYMINPRKFEELVASLIKDMGYDVELTTRGPDGGVDILATQKTGIGELLILVDCKRYKPEKNIGVGMVRSLYGIGQQRRASISMLVTTSFFTKPARQFQGKVPYQLSLKDYNDLVIWLQNYERNKNNSII